MSRPAGVTASAIVAILGGIFALLFAGLAVASLFIETTQPKPPNSAQFVIAGAAMIAALAGIGIWTSVGLFRLRSWAHTSILVFAGFLAAGSLFSLLLTMAMPIPPGFTASTEHIFRPTMAAMFGIPLVIAAWWPFQFNTKSTKAANARVAANARAKSAKPGSIRSSHCDVLRGTRLRCDSGRKRHLVSDTQSRRVRAGGELLRRQHLSRRRESSPNRARRRNQFSNSDKLASN